eukprot:SAG22_NODE_1045_length_5866_cov_1.781516_5_plen_253_part_00
MAGGCFVAVLFARTTDANMTLALADLKVVVAAAGEAEEEEGAAAALAGSYKVRDLWALPFFCASTAFLSKTASFLAVLLVQGSGPVGPLRERDRGRQWRADAAGTGGGRGDGQADPCCVRVVRAAMRRQAGAWVRMARRRWVAVTIAVTAVAGWAMHHQIHRRRAQLRPHSPHKHRPHTQSARRLAATAATAAYQSVLASFLPSEQHYLLAVLQPAGLQCVDHLLGEQADPPPLGLLIDTCSRLSSRSAAQR